MSLLSHTVTVADVERLYNENLALGKRPSEALQGTRTEVHALIHEQNPTPLPLGQPSREFNVSGIVRGPDGYLSHDPVLAAGETNTRAADLATRKASLFGQLTPEQIVASERARSGPDGGHRDAVHYVQKVHGTELWRATDALVLASIGRLDAARSAHLASRQPGAGLSRSSLDREPSGLLLASDGTATLSLDPFEPLRDLAGAAWRTAREAMDAIAKALGGDRVFSWSNAGETSAWTLFFQNTNFAQAPVLQGSASAGSFFIALHTANPGQTGSQSTSEAAYTSYARVAVARTSGAWTIVGNNPVTAENAAAVTFPACTGGSETETYFSFGQSTSGAGVIYGFGALTSPLAVSNGITPSFAGSALLATFT